MIRYILNLTSKEAQDEEEVRGEIIEAGACGVGAAGGSGRESARKLTRARILLKADANAQGWSDTRIASALGVARVTAERIRKRFAEGGCAHAVERRPQPERPARRVLDGQAEARLTTLACSKPPDGRESWTLELLADRMVRLRFVDSVSADTVGRVLKKTRSSRG